ncbi:hypothetical protein [Streptomyces sp. NPDC004230]
MHDSAPPSPSSPEPQGPAAGPSSGNTLGAEETHQIVGAVIAWYSRQLLHARRSGDPARLAELATQRQKCVADQARLQDAGPEEIKRLAAIYTGRLTELEASEPSAEG